MLNKMLLFLNILFLVACNPFIHSRLIPFEDAVNHRWGYISTGNRIIIKPQYIIALEFSAQGIAAVADESGWRYINRQGKLIIEPFIVDNGPDEFREGTARFKEKGKFGFFNL